ncbi:MAG: PEP-CTERM sorting domain-containing protein [Kiritimatiellales bacterium]
MKSIVKIMAGLVLVSVAGVRGSIISENFDSYVPGDLAAQGGWFTANTIADQTITVVAGGSGFDGGAGQSLRMYDNEAGNKQLIATMNFDAIESDVSVTFDYKHVNGAQRPIVSLRSGNTIALTLSMNSSGSVQYHTGAAWHNAGATVTLSNDTWYRVTLTTDLASSTYDISITDVFGGTVLAFSDAPFVNTVSNLSRLVFSTQNEGIGADFYIDNVTLVPEPATLGLFMISGFCIMMCRRSLQF